MLNLCTVADDNFYLKFMALRKSIHEHTVEYKMNLLCLDDDIYQKFNDKKYENLICHKLDDLLRSSVDLRKSQFNEPSFEALNVSNRNMQKAQRIQFIWSLASYYSWYCLKECNMDHIFYVDSDIYFFNDPQILKTISNFGSIGLIENRAPYSPVNGKYNVGIIYFKNDLNGSSCLEFWKNCLLDSGNEYANEYGTCGDQKYLELFEKLYEGVFNIDDYVGHLAPWNIYNHKYIPGKVIYDGKVQDLLFYHFSNFSYDFEKSSYNIAPRHGIFSLNDPFVSRLYEEYYRCLEEMNEDNIRNDSV